MLFHYPFTSLLSFLPLAASFMFAIAHNPVCSTTCFWHRFQFCLIQDMPFKITYLSDISTKILIHYNLQLC